MIAAKVLQLLVLFSGFYRISLAAEVLHVTEYKEFADIHNTNVSFFRTTPYYAGPGPVLLNPARKFSSKSVIFQDSQFSVLPENIFQVFPDLSKLSVQYCGVKSIKQSEFKNGGSLLELDLQYNDLSSIPGLTFVFLTSLEELTLQGNAICVLNRDVFRGLSNLKRLYLGGNDIGMLGSLIFQPLENLEVLDLSDNPIEAIPENLFKYNDKLEEVLLNNCGIKEVDDGAFMGLGKLRVLDLKFNLFTSLHVPSMQKLEADFGAIHQCFIDGSIPRISLSHNRIHALRLKDISSTKDLLLCNNSLQNFDFIEEGRNLEILDLSSNPIDPPVLPSNLFGQMEILRYLNLANLSLSDLALGVFQNLVSLATLDLSENKFDYIDVKVFANLKSLEVLDVSSKELENFDYKGLELLGFKGTLLTWND